MAVLFCAGGPSHEICPMSMKSIKAVHTPALKAARLQSVMGANERRTDLTPEQMAHHEKEFKARYAPYYMSVDSTTGTATRLASYGEKTYGSTGVSKQGDVVKVIPITGSIAKSDYIDWWAWEIVQGTQTLIHEISEAGNEADVKAVVLYIDSPGGEVDGVHELAEVIRKLNLVKPVTACVSGLAASAAYWIAAQCGKVYVTSPQSEVGSIGVFMVHTDASFMMEQLMGIKQTYVVSTDTPDKIVGPSNGPLTEEDKVKLLAQIDPIKADFVKAVKAGRGDRIATDAPQIFQGGVFMAVEAKKFGMIDGVKAFDDIVIEAQVDGNRTARAAKQGKSATTSNTKKMGLLSMLGIKSATEDQITEDQVLPAADAAALATSFKNLQAENGRLTTQTQELDAKYKAAIGENATVKAEVEDLKKEIEALKPVAAEAETLKARVAELEAKSKDAEEGNDPIVKAKAALELELAAKKAEVDAKQAELDKLHKAAGAAPVKVKAEQGDPNPTGKMEDKSGMRTL